MTDAASGIFVLGRHRSGTTWVSNILSAHDEVFTPEHAEHQGQHESAYFSHLVPYCRHGRTSADRLAIRAIFERSDFWHLLFPQRGPTLDIEGLGSEGYFRAAMSEAARLRGCSRWLEKTPAHTVFLGDLLAAFPQAGFVAVKRDLMDAVRSNVYRKDKPGKILNWFRSAIWGELYNKIIKANRTRLYLVSYEALRDDYSREVRGLLEYLGLCPSRCGENEWAPDSSYPDEAPAVPWRFRAAIRVVQGVFAFIPAGICERAGRAWMGRARPLPPWFFRVYHGEPGA